MRDDVRQLLLDQYTSSKAYQEKKQIVFELTFEQFVGLWTKYRLDKLAKLIDSPKGRLTSYLKHPIHRPVLTWTAKEQRRTGVMTHLNACIKTAAQSKFTFHIKKGEKHAPETIIKMSKPKSEATKEKMRVAQQKRRAREAKENTK